MGSPGPSHRVSTWIDAKLGIYAAAKAALMNFGAQSSRGEGTDHHGQGICQLAITWVMSSKLTTESLLASPGQSEQVGMLK